MSVWGRVKALRGSEPVLVVVWPLVGILVAYGVQRGVVSGDLASAIVLPVLGVLLGVGGVAARAQVTPTVKLPDVVRGAARDTLTDVVSNVAPQFDTVLVANALNSVVTTVEQRVGKHRAP